MIHKLMEFAVTVDLPDRDQIITNITLYWLTGTAGTSSWPMYGTEKSTWPEKQKAAPSAVYSGPPGIRRLAERHSTIVHRPESSSGGHFVAIEEPLALAADIRTCFAKLSRRPPRRAAA